MKWKEDKIVKDNLLVEMKFRLNEGSLKSAFLPSIFPLLFTQTPIVTILSSSSHKLMKKKKIIVEEIMRINDAYNKVKKSLNITVN